MVKTWVLPHYHRDTLVNPVSPLNLGTGSWAGRAEYPGWDSSRGCRTASIRRQQGVRSGPNSQLLQRINTSPSDLLKNHKAHKHHFLLHRGLSSVLSHQLNFEKKRTLPSPGPTQNEALTFNTGSHCSQKLKVQPVHIYTCFFSKKTKIKKTLHTFIRHRLLSSKRGGDITANTLSPCCFVYYIFIILG